MLPGDLDLALPPRGPAGAACLTGAIPGRWETVGREQGAEARLVVLINGAHQHELCVRLAAPSPLLTVERTRRCGRGAVTSKNGKSP